MDLLKFFRREKSVNQSIFGFFYSQAAPRIGDKMFMLAYKGWVHACVNAIAEEVASADLFLEKKNKKGKWDPVDHPAMAVLHYVNPFYSFYDLIFEMQAALELDGNAFWYMVRNGKGSISEIWPLDPSKTYVVKSEKEYIAGYVYQNEKGDKIPFEREEILHFKRYNPKDKYRGMGTVEAAAVAIDIDDFSSQWQRNFFSNAAMPSGVLSTDGKLNQEQYDRIKSNWDSKYKGVQNSNKMALLEGGLKWTPMSFTQKDMQFLDGRKDIRDEILGIFRVPKSILGITEDVNRANAEASDYIFGKRTILPKITFQKGKLSEFYLPLWGIDQTQYRISSTYKLPQNEEQELKRKQVSTGGVGWATPNEIRQEEGKDPIPGGDELYVPSSVAPLGQAADQTGTSSGSKGITKAVKKKGTIEPPIDAEYVAEQREELRKTFNDLNGQLKETLLKNLKKKKSAKPAKKKSLVERLLKASEDPTDELVRIVFDKYDEWVGILYNATKDGMAKIVKKYGQDTFALLEVDGAFDHTDPRMMDWLSEHALEDTDSYSKSLKEDISAKIQDGVEQGFGTDKIAGTIEDFFDTQGDMRSLRLARTEVMNAHGASALEAFRQSGVVDGKYWIPEGSACDICKENEDEGVIPLDQDFSSGDDAPTAHPNCECRLGGQTTKDE